jgi:hydroxymethylbilane synthase
LNTYVVGSRRSQLALTQTHWVISQLKEMDKDAAFSVKEIVTKGDRILDVVLSKVGGKGLFVKEIEQALIEGEIDFAVHSMKDMPAELPEGLAIACVPKRVDPRDVFISRDGRRLEELPEGAVVGTSSLRRQAQLLAYRPDLKIVPLRGNIDTRLRRIDEENLDGIVLAAAGLERMGWSDKISQILPLEISLPAVGQGALGIECRMDDERVMKLLKAFNHSPTEKAVAAERAFLHRLEGGCQVPIAAYAEIEGDKVRLTGMVARPDGSTLIKDSLTGENPIELGQSLAERLIELGAEEILAQVRKENDVRE